MPNFDLEAQLTEKQAEDRTRDRVPRRYEIIDAQSGEPVQGVSFVLTPTGEEMHLLSDAGHWVNNLNLGIYYWGDIAKSPGHDNPRTRDIIKSLALYHIIERSLEKIAKGFPKSSSSANASNLRHIAERATKLATELEQQ